MPKASNPRRRDAAASRDRLLTAAGKLFSERGFDRTTAREIGELANVDPTMIARYFRGKAQLYIAALEAEDIEDIPADLLDPDRMATLVDRCTREGPGPILQAAIRPYENPDAQAASTAALEKRLVAPLRDRLAGDGDDRPELRAELLVAAFAGVMLARSSGVLENLAAAPTDQVLAVLRDLLDADKPALGKRGAAAGARRRTTAARNRDAE
jgi:AcrR family transcriptional regulator